MQFRGVGEFVECETFSARLEFRVIEIKRLAGHIRSQSVYLEIFELLSKALIKLSNKNLKQITTAGSIPLRSHLIQN